MKPTRTLFLLSLSCATACAIPEEPATRSSASALASSQGVSYQGVSYQGASYGGASLADAVIDDSAIVAWRQRPDLTWEQRFPDRICRWNAARSQLLSCAMVDLATAPSPLTGATWQAVFIQSDGTPVTVAIQIGASATAIGAVQSDPSLAMFSLAGSTAGSCAPIPQGQRSPGGQRCDAPGGCRTNCDVWLYDVRVPGALDAGGQPIGLCPPGQRATALAGTWAPDGAFTPSATEFTFACTGGTIYKCAAWGYRPWSSALRSDGTSQPLAPYHQACVRAATADYCADGTSWTRNGTLVDVYDYPTTGQSSGFIERTRGGVLPGSASTAFVWESSFDGSGAIQIDHTRYMGIQSPNTPSLECADRFRIDPVVSDGAGGPTRWKRVGTLGQPIVSIDSTPVCAHAELTIGTWLH
ncbi:MAG TPA: ADYC domain-containing protein, partial [Kofleriaceae bacterium]|nr:ADYC domain-containing protein [Kofleriaceae bacterium]